MQTIKDHLREDNNVFPEILYHYTSFQTLPKIIESGNILLGNSYQMNDLKENEIVLDVLTDVLNQLMDEIPLEYTKSLTAQIDRNFRKSVPFIFCLSEEKDSLPQWRGYGDDGNGIVNIGTVPKYPNYFMKPFSD